MKKLLSFLFLIYSYSFSYATVYPCRITGIVDPVSCYSTEKLVFEYSGSALIAQKQTTSTTQTINFIGNTLDTTSLDTFISSDTYARITQWYDQIGNCDAIADSVVQTPWIGKTLNIGNKRAIVFAGGTSVGNVYGLNIPTSCFASKNVTAKDYTVFMVVRPTSSIYRSQAFTPGLGIGTYVSFESSAPLAITGDTTSGLSQILNATPSAGLVSGMVVSTATNGPFPKPVVITNVVGSTVTLNGVVALTTGTTQPILVSTPNTQIYANGNSTPNVPIYADGPATPGGIGISDYNTFTYEPTDVELESGAIVLAITSNSTGVKQWQNEAVRSITSRSGRTVTSAYGYIGRMGLSQQTNFGNPGSCVANILPCGPQNLGGDYHTVALIIYNYGMTPQQRSEVSNALYTRFSIPAARSNPNLAKNFIMVGDSIPSGYSAFGVFGMVPRLQDQIPDARFGNYSVPGSQITPIAGSPIYGYTQGMFPLSVAPIMNYSKQKNVLFILGGGNDMIDQNSLAGSVSVASPAVVTRVAHGMVTGNRVQFSGTLPSPLVAGTVYFVKTVLTANTYTITTTTGGPAINTTGSSSGITVTQYTKNAAGICSGLADVTAQGIASGATKVFLSTVLPRTGNPYLGVLPDTNALIRAGSCGTGTLVDLAAVACLSDPTSACYNDGTHPTDLGMQTAANAMFSPVNSYFGP